jgi:hypothetical protein
VFEGSIPAFPGETEEKNEIASVRRFEARIFQISHVPALRTACTGVNTGRNSIKSGTERPLLGEASGWEFLCVEPLLLQNLSLRDALPTQKTKIFTV